MRSFKSTFNELGQSPSDWHPEVIQIAHKHHLTDKQVRDLIARVGNDREKLERAAAEVSGRSLEVPLASDVARHVHAKTDNHYDTISACCVRVLFRHRHKL